MTMLDQPYLYERLTDGYWLSGQHEEFDRIVESLAETKCPDGFSMELNEGDTEVLNQVLDRFPAIGVEIGAGDYGKTKVRVPIEQLAPFLAALRDVADLDYQDLDYQDWERITSLHNDILYVLTHHED